jgi:hypothetical protein
MSLYEKEEPSISIIHFNNSEEKKLILGALKSSVNDAAASYWFSTVERNIIKRIIKYIEN